MRGVFSLSAITFLGGCALLFDASGFDGAETGADVVDASDSDAVDASAQMAP